MSAIDAFYAAWTDARRTFGAGTPQAGADYDASSQLRRLGGDVAAAAPGSQWSGRAADAYEVRNALHRNRFDRLAELDQRLSRTIDRSAHVVTTGRRNLDALRQWVTDAANSVPPGQQREAQLMRIASSGLHSLREIVLGAHDQFGAIADDIVRVKGEYDALDYQEEEPEPSSGDDPRDEAGEDSGDETDMSSGDIETIDEANRELLQAMLDEYRQLPDGQAKTDRLADIAAIQEALQTPGSYLVYLEKPDDPTQMIPAATSVGDPFKADHVSVTVPGVGSSTRESIAGMTREAAELRNEARSIALEVKNPQDQDIPSIATIAWVGYQPPLNMGQTSVLDDDLAQAGAPKLTSFLGQLDAASHNPEQTVALFGHSYGSLTSGIALGDGASQYVDNAVLYGSPGFQADTPADLGMTDDNFWVMSAFDDPINYVGSLAPYHGWGSDPNDIISDDGGLRFRFPHLETEAGATPIEGYETKTGASGHSEYGRDAGDRMTGYNLATILLDRPDLAVTETPYGFK